MLRKNGVITPHFVAVSACALKAVVTASEQRVVTYAWSIAVTGKTRREKKIPESIGTAVRPRTSMRVRVLMAGFESACNQVKVLCNTYILETPINV